MCRPSPRWWSGGRRVLLSFRGVAAEGVPKRRSGGIIGALRRTATRICGVLARHRTILPSRSATETLMRPVLALALGALLVLPIGAAAQGTPGWSPWGGPDNPGGLFGGDPLDADANQDRRVTHDEVWSWMRRRFDQADR